MSSKLDPITRRDWEKQKSELKELPKFSDLTGFLTKKSQLLESMSTSRLSQMRGPVTHVTLEANHFQYAICKFCKGKHPLFQCKDFLALDISKRIDEVTKLKLCKNCFRRNHQARECFGSKCRICNNKHHTLLHLQKVENQPASTIRSVNTENKKETSINADEQSHKDSNVSLSCTKSALNVLLPTAIIYVLDNEGNKHSCKALLDSASQSNFITETTFNELRIKGKAVNLPISGINNSTSYILKETSIVIQSRVNSASFKLSCLVLPIQITQNYHKHHLINIY